MNKPKTILSSALLLGLTINSVYATSENLSDHSYSEESKKHKHGAHLECPLPKSKEDIISCALEFHPSIKKESYNLDVRDQSLKKEWVFSVNSGRH